LVETAISQHFYRTNWPRSEDHDALDESRSDSTDDNAGPNTLGQPINVIRSAAGMEEPVANDILRVLSERHPSSDSLNSPFEGDFDKSALYGRWASSDYHEGKGRRRLLRKRPFRRLLRRRTQRCRETSDIADLVQKSTVLVGNAGETIKVVADKLTTTLDAVTATVGNANDLVVGLKQGRGAIGMLLRDEQTATDIEKSIASVRDATSSLNHASAQADALVSDF
jgi:hypothetical protein